VKTSAENQYRLSVKTNMDKSTDTTKDDIGFDSKSDSNRRRTINPDGSYNIIRKNNFFKEFHIYQWAITCKWRTFWAVVLGIYISVNFVFAALYYFIGTEYIVGMEGDANSQFWQCYFFSLQTFTTVGYGGLHPKGSMTSAVAGFEAFLGLMTFALATGSLYGRFSKPEASIKYAANALITPFREGKALMMMLCNNKKGNLVEVSAKLTLSWLDDGADGKPVRKFSNLPLDIDKISFLSLTWTLVHVIDDESPLSWFTAEDYLNRDVEIFVFLSCYDDTFAQIVHSRYAYTGEELVLNAKFKRAFYTDNKGFTVLDVEQVGAYDLL